MIWRVYQHRKDLARRTLRCLTKPVVTYHSFPQENKQSIDFDTLVLLAKGLGH